MAEPKPLDIAGNKLTMNLSSKLHTNIQSSLYFRNLTRLKNLQDIFEEIEKEVVYLEPWVPGTNFTASPAFCLLYKLSFIKLDDQKLRETLSYRASPFVRAIGVLFVRFAIVQAQQWSYLAGRLNDKGEVCIRQGGPTMTVGLFTKEHVMLQPQSKFCDLYFPRMALTITKDLEKKIAEFEEKTPDAACKPKAPESRKETKRSHSPDSRRRDRRSPSRERDSRRNRRSRSRSNERRDSRRSRRSRSRSSERRDRRRDRSPDKRDRSPDRRDRSPDRRDRSPDRHRSSRRDRRSRSRSSERRDRRRDRSPDKRDRSPERRRDRRSKSKERDRRSPDKRSKSPPSSSSSFSSARDEEEKKGDTREARKAQSCV